MILTNYSQAQMIAQLDSGILKRVSVNVFSNLMTRYSHHFMTSLEKCFILEVGTGNYGLLIFLRALLTKALLRQRKQLETFTSLEDFCLSLDKSQQ